MRDKLEDNAKKNEMLVSGNIYYSQGEQNLPYPDKPDFTPPEG